MKLSVIVPAYNALAQVMTALNSLQALASMPHEYLVQDDASPEVLFPAVIPPPMALTARNPVNLGFAGNCNAGAARATGDVLFFVNQDVYGVWDWSRGWDTALLAAFGDPSVGLVGARLLFPTGGIQSAGGLFDGHGQPYHRCIGYSNPLYTEVNEPRAVSWVTGAALAIRREVFESLGGFDERYAGGYFEDVDLCLRVRAAGLTIQYAPACTLVHQVGSTGGSPRFMMNARRFQQQWVATGKVTPDTPAVYMQWW